MLGQDPEGAERVGILLLHEAHQLSASLIA